MTGLGICDSVRASGGRCRNRAKVLIGDRRLCGVHMRPLARAWEIMADPDANPVARCIWRASNGSWCGLITDDEFMELMTLAHLYGALEDAHGSRPLVR